MAKINILHKMYIISMPWPQKVVLWMLEMMAASQDEGLKRQFIC